MSASAFISASQRAKARRVKLIGALYLAGLVGVLGGLALGSGCGGGPVKQEALLPASVYDTDLKPNYGRDLLALYYWRRPVVTFRIVGPGQATTIRQKPIKSLEFSPGQKAEIRSALVYWSGALGGASPQFVEVPATDTTAGIDFYCRSPGEDGDAETGLWLEDEPGQALGRAVVGLDNTSGRQFRFLTRHEAGHALGIAGHSKDSRDLMTDFRIIGVFSNDFTDRDRNTIRAGYRR